MVSAGGVSVAIADQEGDRQWAGHASVKGPRWARMFLLTVCLLGLQMTWSIEMSYAFPYLLTMGVSKALMSLVFVAGPLSGLVVQPIIGVVADRSKSRWGRRRPFMLAGCMISVGSLLLLGFTRNFVSLVVNPSTSLGQSVTIFLATLSIYLLDFSINAVQAMDRALLVDTLPADEQEIGNAWAARLMGLGGVLGFFTGYMDLVAWFPFLGRTQLQVLVIIGSANLLGTHILTSICVTERVLLEDGSTTSKSGFFTSVKDIWSNIRTLPPRIRQICTIQFFNWIAWFPILFYSSEWVGEIYTRSQISEGRDSTDHDVESEAMRVGSEALFWQSVVVLSSTLILPMALVYAETALAQQASSNSKQRKWYDTCVPLGLLQVFTLPYLWAASHLIFAVLMFLTWITDTVWGATSILAALGVSSAVTNWAPFSLLGEAIQGEARTSEDIFVLAEHPTIRDPVDPDERAVLMTSTEEDEEDDDASEVHEVIGGPPKHSNPASGMPSPPIDPEIAVLESPGKSSELSEKAGIILGIHNIFIVIPQFLVNGLSAVVFALLAPHRTSLVAENGEGLPSGTNLTLSALGSNGASATRDVDSIGVVLRIGGFSALVACYFAYKLAREVG